MKILFYGNCQLFALKNILNLSNSYITNHIECFSTNISQVDFDTMLQTMDVIITQPISNNYRKLLYLSTEYIIQNCNPSCKIIIFDSCYFNFYYFDLTYKAVNNKFIHNPIDYHYNELINCYKNNMSKEYYIEEFINNINLKTKDDLEQMANKSIFELHKRYKETCTKYVNNTNIKVITCITYIENNYKDKLLFYSTNHPTKYIIQNIAEQIVYLLDIPNTINYNKNVLNHIKCIIYKCIQNAVNFNINECEPLLKDKTNNEDITQLYYDSYKNDNIVF